MKHSHNYVDRTGMRYGNLTVLNREENSKNGEVRWRCRCDCGNEIVVISESLTGGHTKSCGCLKRVSRKAVDMTGKRFGYLTVIERDGTENGKATWKCICDCGKEIVKKGDLLRQGLATNCGCMTFQLKSKSLSKHGLSKTRIFNIWCSMKERCYNPNWKEYDRYGGRGITVCPEWTNDFMAFYEWSMNNGYDDSLSIDRIDFNGNYEPSNCRWADKITQANNTSANHYITRNGETHTLSEWCRMLGVSKSTVYKRIRRNVPQDKWFEKEKLSRKGA